MNWGQKVLIRVYKMRCEISEAWRRGQHRTRANERSEQSLCMCCMKEEVTVNLTNTREKRWQRKRQKERERGGGHLFRLTVEKLWAPQGSPRYLQASSISSSWWPSRSMNSMLVPSKRRGGRKRRKSDSLLNHACLSSWSRSSTNGLAVRLASNSPSQWPAKYRSLLVRWFKRMGLLLQMVTVGKASSLAHSVWILVWVGKASQWSSRFEDQETRRPRHVQNASIQKARRLSEFDEAQMCRNPWRRVRARRATVRWDRLSRGAPARVRRRRALPWPGMGEAGRRQGPSRAMRAHRAARAAGGTPSSPSQASAAGALMGLQEHRESHNTDFLNTNLTFRVQQSSHTLL